MPLISTQVTRVFDRKSALAHVTSNFKRLHDYDVKTVVDPCPADMGRDDRFHGRSFTKQRD